LGKKILGVSDVLLTGSNPEQARRFDYLKDLDALLKIGFGCVVALIVVVAVVTLPFNLAAQFAAAGSPSADTRTQRSELAFTLFYSTDFVASVTLLLAMQYQLARIDSAVASVQSAPVQSQGRAIYSAVRHRLWLQRLGMATMSAPGTLLYLLAAVRVVPNPYLFMMLIGPVEVLLKGITILLFRPVKSAKQTTTGQFASSPGQREQRVSASDSLSGDNAGHAVTVTANPND